jgi:hypothetical protein
MSKRKHEEDKDVNDAKRQKCERIQSEPIRRPAAAAAAAAVTASAAPAAVAAAAAPAAVQKRLTIPRNPAKDAIESQQRRDKGDRSKGYCLRFPDGSVQYKKFDGDAVHYLVSCSEGVYNEFSICWSTDLLGVCESRSPGTISIVESSAENTFVRHELASFDTFIFTSRGIFDGTKSSELFQNVTFDEDEKKAKILASFIPEQIVRYVLLPLVAVWTFENAWNLALREGVVELNPGDEFMNNGKKLDFFSCLAREVADGMVDMIVPISKAHIPFVPPQKPCPETHPPSFDEKDCPHCSARFLLLGVQP